MSETDHIDRDRRRLLGAAALATAGARLGLFAPVEPHVARAALASPSENQLLSLASANAWLNSPALTAAGLRGKVVLVDFWTYTCINWIRTVPYVRAWAEKYKADGLVVIGVHAPEFEFEHELTNVRRAVKEMRVDYPVAIDNDFAIWRAFRNQYWPALYLVGAEGEIRYRHFGEGDYADSERAIQRRLADAGARTVDRKLVSVEGRGIEVAHGHALGRLGHRLATGFSSVPMPSISTDTRCPSASGPMPASVPVSITSPGMSVK